MVIQLRMEACARKPEGVEKFDIKLKSKPKDGVILQLHHTVRGSKGECKRIRFSTGTFDDTQEKLACTDTVGNLFILDFCDLKFWKLSKIGPCTATQFFPNKIDTLLVATLKLEIDFLNIETGSKALTLSGHTAPVKHISFSCNKLNNLLTSSTSEAILWEMTNFTKYFTLNTYLGAQIQQIMFTPGGEYLVACFQNDTVQIWKHESMKSVKQIIPNELKNMKNIAFTMNGRAMAMAGLSNTLILFSMDTWKALKTIDLSKYDISGAIQVSFIPQVFDGGANKILGILCSDCVLRMFDLESMEIVHTIHTTSSGIRKFVVSPSGKYFLCILQLGEVNIYNTSYVLDMARNKCKNKADHPNKDPLPSTSKHKNIFREEHMLTKAEVEQKMRVCMDSARLRRILMQYGEYPDKFRSVIWRSLLNTPNNKVAYSALIDKGVHPVYKDIEKQFSIHSTSTLKSLKRLLSCLANWCPLFAVMKFLPGFVFPFVKVLQKDPLLLFECVASVLLNYCQLWFEYAPFPPISIMAMTENILGEHDKQLLEHFCEVGVTSQTYALNILETAFSEVLTCSEWLILWDHILSNEPAFILMAVVSYSIVQKNAIRRLHSIEQLETFYHMQNPICKKSFLKKAYAMLNETPEEIHPRRFFKNFESLEKGDCYQQFTGYPKATIFLKLQKRERKLSDTGAKFTRPARSQEQVISERFVTPTNSKTWYSEDDDTIQTLYAPKNSPKPFYRESFNKGDYKKTHDKEDSIHTILRPVTVQSKRSPESKHKEHRKENSAHKHKKSKTKKTENKCTIESVVQNLFRTTDSDISDI